MSAKQRQKYSGNERQDASFEVLDGGRSRVIGALHFTTVSHLLIDGTAAIGGSAGSGDGTSVIDLAGITLSDSAGLALLIEWLSVAKSANRVLRYENIPSQIQQLARLSEVEGLLAPT